MHGEHFQAQIPKAPPPLKNIPDTPKIPGCIIQTDTNSHHIYAGFRESWAIQLRRSHRLGHRDYSPTLKLNIEDKVSLHGRCPLITGHLTLARWATSPDQTLSCHRSFISRHVLVYIPKIHGTSTRTGTDNLPDRSLISMTIRGGRRSPAVACWASDHWVASSNPLRGKFRH